MGSRSADLGENLPAVWIPRREFDLQVRPFIGKLARRDWDSVTGRGAAQLGWIEGIATLYGLVVDDAEVGIEASHGLSGGSEAGELGVVSVASGPTAQDGSRE
jgi:hypothetical protein